MDPNYLIITAILLSVALFAIGYVIFCKARQTHPSIRCAQRGPNEEIEPEETKIRIEEQLRQLMHREAILRDQQVHLDVVERLAVDYI